ncbi:MAG: hypothetical protein ACTSYA_07980 [Candidatus Kariarchaeaceae archaeon]
MIPLTYFFDRKALTGALVALFIVVFSTALLVSVIDNQELTAMKEDISSRKGNFWGFVWVVLFLIALPNAFFMDAFLPIDLIDDIGANDLGGNANIGIIIYLLWMVGLFLGGLASSGGMHKGAGSAGLAAFIVSLVFSIFTVFYDGEIFSFSFSFFSGIWGFIVVFLLSWVIGSLLLISTLGSIVGGLGGALGKTFLTKPKGND